MAIVETPKWFEVDRFTCLFPPSVFTMIEDGLFHENDLSQSPKFTLDPNFLEIYFHSSSFPDVYFNIFYRIW